MIDEKYYPAFMSAIRELAVRYSLPELLDECFFENDKERENSAILSTKVNPSGQLSAIVSELDVKITVQPSALDNIFRLVLTYSYKHFSLGGNKDSRSFYLVTKENVFFDKGCPLYVGLTDENCVHEIQSSVNKRLAKQLEEKDKKQ